jgi:hypothetical protein
MVRAVLALIMWTAEGSLSGMSRHPASSRLIPLPVFPVKYVHRKFRQDVNKLVSRAACYLVYIYIHNVYT